MKIMIRATMLVVVFTLVISCASTHYASFPTASTDIIGYLLSQKGLTRDTARCDGDSLDMLASYNVMMQKHFMKYWKNPYEFPKYVYSWIDTQAAYADKDNALFEHFAFATTKTGHRVSGYYDRIPAFTPKTNPIEEALEKLFKRCNSQLPEEVKISINGLTEGITDTLKLRIANLIVTTGEAKYYRDRALRNYPASKWQHAFECATKSQRGDENIEDGDIVNWDLGQNLDYDDLYTGAALNIRAILDLYRAISATNEIPCAFEFDTPLGKIAFNGKNENNTYDAGKYCLIIDMSGDDTYNGPAGASYSVEHPVSIVMDLKGNDNYISDKNTACSQGAGIMGYGFLLDYAGNDTYKALDNAQGMCYFGVGFLVNSGGNDVFEAEHAAQGSAFFGVAALLKKGGDDQYYCYSVGQGFGFVGGYGCLIDTDGNDSYIAEPYKPLFSPAKGGHDNMRNYNFCQGAGWGQRGDIFGGHSMAGGTGVLQDLGGDDTYLCGVYGQATGYWYGTGILHDKSGNDTYDASFFVQSGTAHMGLTMLLDEEGNDKYHVWHAISLAGTHDFSVSYLIDKGGNDVYDCWEWKDKDGKQTLENTGIKGTGGGVLLGCAITNSVGIFINIGGVDTYNLYANDVPGLASPNVPPGNWRYNMFTVGMFMDIGGVDTYNIISGKGVKIESMPENNKMWPSMAKNANQQKIFGMGIDINEGTVKEAQR